MPKITVISRNGSARDVEAENGLSLMEVIRDNGFDELLLLQLRDLPRLCRQRLCRQGSGNERGRE